MQTIETSRWAEFPGQAYQYRFPKADYGDRGRDKNRDGALSGGSLDARGGGNAVGKIASVRHLKRIIWDRLVFETSGGSNNLDVDDLRKEDARKITQALNGWVSLGEREMTCRSENSHA